MGELTNRISTAVWRYCGKCGLLFLHGWSFNWFTATFCVRIRCWCAKGPPIPSNCRRREGLQNSTQCGKVFFFHFFSCSFHKITLQNFRKLSKVPRVLHFRKGMSVFSFGRLIWRGFAVKKAKQSYDIINLTNKNQEQAYFAVLYWSINHMHMNNCEKYPKMVGRK